MLDVLESAVDSSLNYFNVKNLSFDHPLTPLEIDEFKSMIFSLNNLSQIYFKGSIDVDSIETVKNLLSISGFVDDKMIEKCVAVMLPRESIDRLLSSSYENPATWHIAYNVEDNGYVLADIPKCRTLFSYIDRIKLLVKKENLSSFETILRVYDIVKFLDYDNSDFPLKPDFLADVVVAGKASSLGFNKLFSYVLNELGIKSFVGKERSGSGGDNFITAVEVCDEKYGIDGIYLFDPSMDTLPKEVYKSDDIRMINYNYFGLKFSDIDYSTYGDSLTGPFGIIAISDFDYSNQKRNSCNDSVMKKDFGELERTFDLSYKELYDKIKKSPPISFDSIEEAIDNVYGENKIIPNYKELVRENYFSRKSELFNPTTNELLDVMLK